MRNALRGEGIEARIPLTKRGKPNGLGYADLEIIDKNGRTTYLECKTFNIKSLNSTQSTFYFSPLEDFKIASDAHHFLRSPSRRNSENILIKVS